MQALLSKIKSDDPLYAKYKDEIAAMSPDDVAKIVMLYVQNIDDKHNAVNSGHESFEKWLNVCKPSSVYNTIGLYNAYSDYCESHLLTRLSRSKFIQALEAHNIMTISIDMGLHGAAITASMEL